MVLRHDLRWRSVMNPARILLLFVWCGLLLAAEQWPRPQAGDQAESLLPLLAQDQPIDAQRLNAWILDFPEGLVFLLRAAAADADIRHLVLDRPMIDSATFHAAVQAQFEEREEAPPADPVEGAPAALETEIAGEPANVEPVEAAMTSFIERVKAALAEQQAGVTTIQLEMEGEAALLLVQRLEQLRQQDQAIEAMLDELDRAIEAELGKAAE
jgi:hypothetical protein